MDYAALGQQIRRLRKAKRLSQQTLAEAANVSPSFIGHVERGTRKASMETLISIANCLAVGTDALLRDSLRTHDSDESLSPEEKRFANQMIDLARSIYHR
jgi:transcriptional regulator with XRE-family HTH domain